jgi:hypothetical protein
MFVHEDQPSVRSAGTGRSNVHNLKEHRTEIETMIVSFDNILPSTAHLSFVSGLQQVIINGSFHIKNVSTQEKSPKSVYVYYVCSNLVLCALL